MTEGRDLIGKAVPELNLIRTLGAITKPPAEQQAHRQHHQCQKSGLPAVVTERM